MVNEHASELAGRLHEWDEANDSEYFAAIALVGFFEELGFLWARDEAVGLVRDYTKEIFGPPAQHYYSLLRPYVEGYRQDSPDFAVYFEKLAKSVSATSSP